MTLRVESSKTQPNPFQKPRHHPSGSDLLFVHLTTMSVAQSIQHRMIGSLQNSELEGMFKEAVVL
jgi:hypothetical protein